MYGEEASKLARETKRTIDHFPPYNDSLVRSITREIRHLHETCQALIRDFDIQKQHEEQEAETRLRLLYGQPEDGAPGEGARRGGGGEVDPNFTTLEMLDGPIGGAPSASYSSTTTVVQHPHPPVPGSSSTTGTTTVLQQSTSSSIAPAASRSTISTLPHLSQQALQSAKEARLLHLKTIFWTKYLVHQVPLLRNKRILMAYHAQRVEKIKDLAWAYTSRLPDSLSQLLSPDELVFFQEYERGCRNEYTSLEEFAELDLGLGMIQPPKEVFITVRVVRDCGDIVTDSGAVLSLRKDSEHFVKRGDVERLITQGYLKHVA
ncbi:DNA replication protein psf1 [Linnemannia hyalina]|uniref:DNA replication complex GINS protein PSF1 n=1 Tax=Linnemannia hyalina TaxID=64524 RepID=A0A9P7XUT6_9FUNG|nr:DNA replication protein psf1 [Linnemannia hyalina]